MDFSQWKIDLKDMSKIHPYIYKFYLLTGRSGDIEGKKHWSRHAEEHGLESALINLIDDQVIDMHTSIHKIVEPKEVE